MMQEEYYKRQANVGSALINVYSVRILIGLAPVQKDHFRG